MAASAGKSVFAVADKTYAPGERISGAVRARDKHGNPAGAIKLSFAGAPVAASTSGDDAVFEIEVPETLPANRELELVAESGSTISQLRIKTAAGPAVEATITAVTYDREARVRVIARDRFGNVTGSKSLRLEVDEASTGALVDEELGVGTRLRANAGARSTMVRVLVGSNELASKRIEFSPRAMRSCSGATRPVPGRTTLGS